MTLNEFVEALRQLVGYAEDAGLSLEALAAELKEQAAAVRQCVVE